MFRVRVLYSNLVRTYQTPTILLGCIAVGLLSGGIDLRFESHSGGRLVIDRPQSIKLPVTVSA